VPKEIQGEIDCSILALAGDLAEDNGTVAQFEAPLTASPFKVSYLSRPRLHGP
jgi:hypothetical protein